MASILDIHVFQLAASCIKCLVLESFIVLMGSRIQVIGFYYMRIKIPIIR